MTAKEAIEILSCYYEVGNDRQNTAMDMAIEALNCSEIPNSSGKDTNVPSNDCTDCIRHGGDYECDHVHCHKGDVPETNVGDMISRKAAIDAVYKCTDIFVNNLPVMVDKADAYKALTELPSAQPEREKGKWTYGENDGQDGWFCSECGFFVPWYYDFYGLDNIDFIAEYHTCPKCDTKMMEYTGMRGEQDE